MACRWSSPHTASACDEDKPKWPVFQDVVRLAPCWRVVTSCVVEKKDVPATFAEGNKLGNRLTYIIRSFGSQVRQLHLQHTLWLYSTGLEELGRCTHLHVLDLTGCRNLALGLFARLVRYTPQLRELYVRGCVRECEPAQLQELWDRPASEGLRLTHLDIKGLAFEQDRYDLAHLSQLLGRLARGHQLEKLIVGCSEADTEWYQGCLSTLCDVVTRSGPTLRQLEITSMIHIRGTVDRPGGFYAMPPQGQAPYEQQEGEGGASGAVEDRFAAMMRSLQNVEVLNLRCIVLGGRCGLGALRLCPSTSITCLNLRSVPWVSDDDMEVLLRRNGRVLQQLNVSCCDALTDATLERLAEACGGGRPAGASGGAAASSAAGAGPRAEGGALRLLDVCYARGMSAQGLLRALLRLPLLTHLGCSGFVDITDSDLSAVARSHPGLEMLGCGGIPSLSDDALHAVAAHCPSLRSLYVADLPYVTMKGVQACLFGCSGLARVCASGTGLSAREQADLKASHLYVYDPDMGLEE